MSVTAALIGGAASLLGGALSGKKQRDSAATAYQQYLAADSTKHQRNVKDLRAAGLNPILSATSGMGGSAAPAPVAQVPDYSQAGSSAANVAKAWQETKTSKDQSNLIADQSSLIEEQRLKMAAERNSAQAMAGKTQAETLNVIASNKYIDEKTKAEISNLASQAALGVASARKVESDTLLNDQELKARMAEYEKLRKAGDVHATKAGSFLAWLRAVTEATGFHSSASTRIGR